jgi:UDP-N-acetyl-D-glucosamine dehydrogenase
MSDSPTPGRDTAALRDALLDKLRSKQATVGIVGLGYVGLPLGRAFADAGYRVLGFDVDQTKVDKIQAGTSYIDAVPSEVLARLRAEDRIAATADYARVAEVDALAICVPTPLTSNREPDTSYIASTADSVGPYMTPGTLIVLESTTYPGTTEELLAPRLTAASPEKLVPGQDFFVAYSPERENPGDPRWSTARIPKVVGADDPASRAVGAALYEGAVAQVVEVSSARVAEASKLLENIYRCVNIAMVNELKVCFDKMDIDVFEVIDAARTKPFGFQAFWPGPGLGGHCIPIDPFYLSWKAREYGVLTRFIDLAGEVNTAMPAYVMDRLADALNDHRKPLKGSRVLMLGVAYKKDVDDVRESPALTLLAMLQAKGAEVSYHDPHVARVGSGRHYKVELDSVELTPALLAESDVVLIVTDHTAVDYAQVVEHAQLVVDTRNATRLVRVGRENVVLA